MYNKKQKKHQKASDKENQKETNRGKPCDIQNTTLNIPNIWTNDQTCLRLIKYLSDIGRHNCLHQAGKQSGKKDEKNKQEKPEGDNKQSLKKKEIENTRKYFEKCEDFSEQLFGHKCETKRCIVFFFRSNIDDKNNNYDNITACPQDCKDVLFKLSALFTHKFFMDLIEILNSSNNIQHLISAFISNRGTPASFSPIIQNLFIKYMIETMKEKNSMHDFEMKTRDELERTFYNFVESPVAKEELEKFIREIKLIFNRDNDQYLPQELETGELDNLDEERHGNLHYMMEDMEMQREYNHYSLP
ncbi:unnamed protein product [Paramecium octaurelia]|uniref:Uncharacterized protein n=1 Tax=Paramecium octaurelia TaxID=43137 RepID=A0A8S1UT63_PAROT|nr:unnamed protein product [Paramecium octaurelia]